MMSSSPTVVRRLLAQDWELYRDLRLRALADSPDAFGATLAHETTSVDWKSKLAEACSSTSDRPIVVERDGVPVGLAWGKLATDSPNHAYVYQMWVTPQFRGKGAGMLLLDDVLAWASDLGIRSVFLRVTCGDTPARRLYERAGFVPEGLPEPIRPGADVLVQRMRRDLSRNS